MTDRRQHSTHRHETASLPPSIEMRKLADLSRPPYSLLSHGRLRRAVGDGSLHGHQYAEHKPWEVAESVALAWKAGATPAEQRRICPMCRYLAAHGIKRPR